MKNTSFYYFNVKGIVAPEYIVEYKYIVFIIHIFFVILFLILND